MTLERFQRLADTYGGRLERWPAEDRARGEALLARHPELADDLRKASDLDLWLDGLPSPLPGADLADRIVRSAERRSAPVFRLDLVWLGAGLVATGALAGALAVLWLYAPSGGDGEGWAYGQTTAFGALSKGPA